jgi:hypothetical protein
MTGRPLVADAAGWGALQIGCSKDIVLCIRKTMSLGCMVIEGRFADF